MTINSLPAPMMFGLPPKFSQWRTHQAEAVESQLKPKPRFLLQVCPTGFGKSIVYFTAAQLISGRTAILTSTKGLQTQLMSDFGSMTEVADIRGRANYKCRLNTAVNCDSGPCLFGVKCPMMDEGGCFYFSKLREAKNAKIVITNYSYWMAQNEYSNGLGTFNMLILDEAHSSPDHVIDHIGVVFTKRTNKILNLKNPPSEHGLWRIWAINELDKVTKLVKQTTEEKKILYLKNLVRKLSRLVFIDSSWVWEDNKFSINLCPIWPTSFTEDILFLNIPKVILTSATVIPKTAALLGISNEQMELEKYPHSFPVQNRSLIHLPTVRMNYRIGEVEHRLWTNKVDQIIRDRLETKGIIHTISYTRRDMVMERSKYKKWMITHNRKGAESTISAFKKARPPCILVSPTAATGHDFPNDECRWQIIVKLPYPDLRGNIMKTRSKKDKEYINYITMQQLIQTTGRGVRNKNDYCETFIIDDNITWFLQKNEHLQMEWFRGTYKTKVTIPPPLKGGNPLINPLINPLTN